MERLMGGITMHKPLVPPGVVLTLGSGFDFWAIRAVQEWPVCVQWYYILEIFLLTPLSSFTAMPSHCAWFSWCA
jgi:hypothetical protein